MLGVMPAAGGEAARQRHGTFCAPAVLRPVHVVPQGRRSRRAQAPVAPRRVTNPHAVQPASCQAPALASARPAFRIRMALPAPTLPIAIRSYGADSQVDRHDFAQVVLPLDGQLHMDIAGAGARLDRSLGAFVEAGARHDQISDAANRSIILDLHAGDLDPRIAHCLARRPNVALLPEARSLDAYKEALTLRGGVFAHRLRLWIPLLLDTLIGEPPQPRARLAPLLATVEAQPARAWTAQTMAAQLGVSASRVHALFQQELGTTPRAWLSALRLGRARDLLVRTALPIAEVAYCCGYADQSALTRAMRRADGQTPAQLRRRTRG